MKGVLAFLLCAFLLVEKTIPQFIPDEDIAIHDSTCMLMLESFATVSAAYTYCTISHARPITLCEQCVLPYLKVTTVYQDITNLSSNHGLKCENELANLDRLQVFESGYKYVNDLWNRADCNSCFVHDPKTGQPTPVLTNLVKDILNASSVHQSCIAKYRNTSATPDTLTCEMCLETYQHVNSIYNNFKATEGKAEFCMDIVDLINNTRSDWSTNIGCCTARRKPEFVFILSALCIGILPILFYVLIYVFTPKKQHTLIERKRWNEDPSISHTSEPVEPTIES